MKFTLFLMLAFTFSVSADVFGQKVNIHVKDARMTQVLQHVREQSGYAFMYNPAYMQKAKPVSASIQDRDILEALPIIFSGQPFDYTVRDKVITIVPRVSSVQRTSSAPVESLVLAYPEVRGQVVDSLGRPLGGASVRVVNAAGQRTQLQTSTDRDGIFVLTNVPDDALIEVSYIGYITQQVSTVSNMGVIAMQPAPSNLDEVVINAGYYTVTDKERTGSISRITSKEIGQQPVANPLAAMQGRMAGVNITQSSGTPGGGFDIQIRGLNSLRAEGNAPLYIIDGVPYPSQSESDYTLSGPVIPVTNGSPLNNFNPNDIENIEVLKDADATAIYGSRGSNGVVLITTKRGTSDKTSFSLQSSTAVSTISRYMDLMNTEEYLKMRRDAFANDGVTEYPANAYDVNGTWDENRYMNWQKEFIGSKAVSQNTQFSVNGGKGKTTYLLSAGHRNDNTVFVGDFGYKRTNFSLNLNHASADEKFEMQISVNKSLQNTNLMMQDFSNEVYLSPNAPVIYNEAGLLNWENNTFENPLAKLNAKYKSENQDFVARVNIGYKIFPNLKFTVTAGTTDGNIEEYMLQPSTMYNPSYNLTSEWSFMGTTSYNRNTWIVEPRLGWNKQNSNSRWDALIGATFEERSQSAISIQASNFTSNDFIMNAANAAVQQITKDTESFYKYLAVFSRINYIHRDKYILNLTGRRDGSSRFGSNNRFANFGAVGVAWLFSREEILEEKLWLSYGKLRGTYGIAGSDLIGDYQHLNTFGMGSQKYDGFVGLDPLRLYNPNFSWETNKKMEAALELEFFRGKIAPSVSWYRNRSSNQLVGIPLPGTTGFNSVNSNLNATVQNTGWEFTLSTSNIENSRFKWLTQLNGSLPKNKLIAFPNLSESTYASRYEIGEPLSIKKVYKFVGINSLTGLYEVQDINGDGIINKEDQAHVAQTGIRFHGGISNQFSFGNWSLDFLWQFVKQKGYTADYYSGLLGIMSNQPAFLNNYWSESNPSAPYQRPTSGANAVAVQANQYYKASDAVITDISFARLKNLQLQYIVPAKRLKARQLSLFIQGQNLLTITRYHGADPESSGNYLPVLRTFSFGINYQF